MYTAEELAAKGEQQEREFEERREAERQAAEAELERQRAEWAAESARLQEEHTQRQQAEQGTLLCKVVVLEV